jgi:hypothetical protein
MTDDFCLIHGYEFMRCDKVWGAIPYCEECDRERASHLQHNTHINKEHDDTLYYRNR